MFSPHVTTVQINLGSLFVKGKTKFTLPQLQKGKAVTLLELAMFGNLTMIY
jgi:hypothetical protein